MSTKTIEVGDMVTVATELGPEVGEVRLLTNPIADFDRIGGELEESPWPTQRATVRFADGTMSSWYVSALEPHEHSWGPVSRGHFTGEPSRSCRGTGCRYITLDLCDGCADGCYSCSDYEEDE